MKYIYTILALLCVIACIQAQDINITRTCRPQLLEKGVPLHSIKSHKKIAIGSQRAEMDNHYIGDKRQLVVMAAFADKAFTNDKEQTLSLWNDILNAENYTNGQFAGSIHDYFRDQSYGLFNVIFDLHYVALTYNTSKYKSTQQDDENSRYLVEDVMEQIKEEVEDWSVYDWDNDGYVDQLLIIYAGKGQNDGGGSNTIWPHQWWLSMHNNSETISVSSGGKDYTIDCYCCVQELSNSNTDGTFGTICHEYSHCFGLPDLYYGSISFLYKWDLMDLGCYSGSGFKPCGYSAFERAFMGWLTPTELHTPVYISNMPALSDQPDAYLVRNDGHSDEYYLIENRQNTGWDASLPGSGIVIAHVDYNDEVFRTGIVNTSYIQRYNIFHANNKSAYSSISNAQNDWAYPYNGNNELTDTSKPAAALNNANTNGTLKMSKPITQMNISDGLASFCFLDPSQTGIDDVDIDAEQDGTWYTILGIRLNSKPTTKGLYIHNNKIIEIR